MCWKWFLNLFGGNPPSTTWEHSDRVALLFGINNYPGSANDLNGCINDINLAEQKLKGLFQIRKFKDSEVTVANFKKQVEYAIENSVVGDMIYIHYSGHGTYVEDKNGDEIDGYDEALYLYDGVLIDDDLNAILQTVPNGVTVVLLLDSCFSGSATRDPHRIRFMPPKFQRNEHLQIKRSWYEDMKWVVLSGCAENQTSADAFINGCWNGAFTYFALNCLVGNMTYITWHAKIREYLPNRDFDQEPTLEGNLLLINKQVLT
jgi:hypothetical protein